jgi:sporulation protein YlmC with PRC-barrel domain
LNDRKQEVAVDNGTQGSEDLFGYDVMDADGNKIGDVDGLWIDSDTGRPEYVGVYVSWLLRGKTHIIPLADAEISNDQIRLPYSEDQIKNAPVFGTDVELAPEQEDEIYQYYGLDRSTASPAATEGAAQAGTAAGAGSADTALAGAGTGVADTGLSGASASDAGTTVPSGPEGTPADQAEPQVASREVEPGTSRLRRVVRSDRTE